MVDTRPTIMLSGGFDPIHIGHVRMFKDAMEFGDVVVALNSDKWLRRKKNFCFMPWDERAEILRSIRHVGAVVAFDDRDDTACEALKAYNPTYFGNGGDRTDGNTPETELCALLGIQMMWGLGGENDRHSTPTFERAARELYGDGLRELFG